MTARLAVISAWVVAAALWTGFAALTAIRTATPLADSRADFVTSGAAQVGLAQTVPAVVFPAPDAAIAELLGRSPFDEARRQFQRVSVDTPPPSPPEPPRLLGITSNEGKRSALVEWRPSGETQRLTVGVETPLGVVTRIGDSDLTLKVGEAETVVSMYD